MSLETFLSRQNVENVFLVIFEKTGKIYPLFENFTVSDFRQNLNGDFIYRLWWEFDLIIFFRAKERKFIRNKIYSKFCELF